MCSTNLGGRSGMGIQAEGGPAGRRVDAVRRTTATELGARVFEPRGGVMTELLLDAAGRRRSPATMPGLHTGRPPRNKGLRYPADAPTVEENRRSDALRRRRRERPTPSRPDRRALARWSPHRRSAVAHRARSRPPPRAPCWSDAARAAD